MFRPRAYSNLLALEETVAGVLHLCVDDADNAQADLAGAVYLVRVAKSRANLRHTAFRVYTDGLESYSEEVRIILQDFREGKAFAKPRGTPRDHAQDMRVGEFPVSPKEITGENPDWEHL